jgi:hypothetical protein
LGSPHVGTPFMALYLLRAIQVCRTSVQNK